MSPMHSPLPWVAFDEIEDGLVIYDANGLIVDLTDHYKTIVRAVNSHDRLLAAAKEVATTYDEDVPIYVLKLLDQLRAAIAAAEEPAP